MIKLKFVDSQEWLNKKTLSVLRDRGLDIMEVDDPDFIFYSCFGYEHLKYDCVKIFYTGENFQPDFNECDYGIGFGYGELQDRYLRFPLYHFYEEDIKNAKEKHLKIGSRERVCGRKFCNFVYSNSQAVDVRTDFFNMLSKYKTVDSGGRYLNNIGGAVDNKLEFQKQYKFSIAFENSSSVGYTTEKLLQALAAGTVPIYFGNPEVAKDFNKDSFINGHDFNSMESLVDYVIEVDGDDEKYMKYLRAPSFLEYSNPWEQYGAFLEKILVTDVEEAYRRNNTGIGQRYQDSLKKSQVIKDRLENPQTIADKIFSHYAFKLWQKNGV